MTYSGVNKCTQSVLCLKVQHEFVLSDMYNYNKGAEKYSKSDR